MSQGGSGERGFTLFNPMNNAKEIPKRELAAKLKSAAVQSAQATSQISTVEAATSAAQVVTGTQPVTPIIVTATQPETLNTSTHKEAQSEAFSQITDRRRQQSDFRSHVIKDIKSDAIAAKTGIYKFGKLSYEIAGQGITSGTPYVAGFFGGMHQALPYRLIFMFLFFFVFYRIIYNICIFFGIDQIILSMYMGWLSFIILLFTFLPYDYGDILDE